MNRPSEKPEHVRREGRRKDLEARRRDGVVVTQEDYDALSDYWRLPHEKLPSAGCGAPVLIRFPPGPFGSHDDPV
jgi:hypothetical protein